jgi:hypothetical protein
MRDHDVGALDVGVLDVGVLDVGVLYRTKCSCINLDYSMQMHLVI